MKKHLLLMWAILSVFAVQAQTVIFNETFETLPLSVTSSGTPNWERSSYLKNSGTYSDSTRVAANDTSYLTTNQFSTTGNSFVILEFAHICKIEFFDAAVVEVSVDNGTTWTKLIAAQYLGNGQFATTGEKFTAAAYPIWDPSNPATIPQNTWWRTETFDISSLASNQASVRVRFKLSDGNGQGSGGNYGWLIDDIKVTTQTVMTNLVLKNIVAPVNDECYNGNETVSIVIGNIGTNPVTAPFTASYKLGNATPVNETVNATIASGDSITYVFNTPISFTLQGNDSTINLKTYVNMSTDPYQTNDSLSKNIKFLYTPPSPIADHDTIIYGNTATLGAVSANKIKWYATPTSTTVLDTGATFTTPVLYGNKAYYASAQSGTGGSFMFTEICHWKSAPGVPTAGWPSYLIADDYVEITGPPGGNLSGYILEIWTGTALEGAQTLANGTILSPSGTCIIATGQLTTSTPSPSNFYYHSGHTITQSSTTAKGYILKNSSGVIVDAAVYGTLTFPGTSGVTTVHWTGSTPAVSGSGIRLNGPYTKSSANWADATVSVPQNPNTPNTGVEVPSTGCESPRTEVWAIVTGNPPVDAGIVSIDQPLSPTNLQTQNVYVSLQNFGTNTLTSTTINWKNNGTAQTPYSWNGSLASNQIVSVNIGSFTPILGNNNIVAWVSNPNGVTDPMPLNDTASKTINAFDPLNGIYTIGGSNPNFTNFATAQYALANYGVSGPVTFKVRSGTYNEKLLLPAYTGASAINTVTFIPDAGATVTLTVSDTFVVRINSGTYYILDGSNNGTNSRDFSIVNNSTNANTAAIWISGTTDYITLKNLNIAAGSNTVVSTFGIHAGGASITTTATGNNNNLTIHNNLITKAYFGIYARAVSTAKNNNLIIKNNIIGSNTASEYVLYRGVDIQGANAPLVEANEIFNQRVTTSVNVSGVEIGIEVTDAKIKKNRIYGQRSTSTSGYGAYGINIASGTGTSGVEISNNFISDIVTANYSVTSTVWNPFGIRIVGGTGHKIWHNNINMHGAPTTGTAASMSAAIMITSNTATGMDIRNNILSNSMTGVTGSKAYTVYAVTGTTFGQINFNDYYVGGTYGVLAYGGADITTLTAWKTFTSQDVNSINVNPNFVAPNNLYTFSTQINNAGTPITLVTDDIDGNPRHPSTPDIGATEFNPINLDMSVAEIVSPLSKCALSASTPMTVKVKNFGASTVTTFNISYTINGGSPVTETFNGSLATDSLHTFTFATAANLSQNMLYNIKYKIMLTGDQFLLNDSLVINIQPKHDFYAGNYFMGFETTENFSSWSVLDVNNDSRKWEPGYNSTTYARTGSQSARFFNSSTIPGNDWLITDCFDFVAGNTYEIKFWYRVESATNPQKVTLMLGNAPVPTAFTDTLVYLNMFTNTTYQSASAYISVPTTGSYYFGWHATSPAANYYTFIDDINIKLIPPQEASLIAVVQPYEGCDLGMDTVGIKIVNTGGSIINGNLTASYQVVGSPTVVTENVTATINVLDTLLFKFNTLVDLSTTIDSTFKINAWINLLNDPFTYNDSVLKQVESLITPNNPIVTPDTVNYGNPATLVATSNANILWYDALLAQIPIHSGDTFVTPPLFATTTYYAEASNNTLQSLSMPNSLPGATSGAGTTNFGLVFDVLTTTLLKSVTVYPVSSTNASGTVTIDVINSSGTVLHTVTANVTGSPAATPVAHEITLDFQLQPGTNLKMRPGYTGISGLLFEPAAGVPSSGNYGYPFQIPGVISINHSTLTAHPTNTARLDLYYYFYNWQVGAPGCFSSRIPVTAVVNLPQFEPGIVEITSPVDETCTDNSETVSIMISNSGSAAITTGLTATYIVNNGTPVTEPVNITVLSGDTVSFTFSTPINLNLTTGDTTLNITTYVTLTGDPYQGNDTISSAFTVSFTPSSPIADNDTVPYGTIATVGAISPNDVTWYPTPTSTTILGTGPTYTTPVLYGNTPYYAVASEGTGSAFVGAYDYSIGTSSTYANTTYYMIFDVLNLQGVNIKAIDIFPSVAAGAAYEIRLLNSSGTMLQSYSNVTTVASGQRETALVDFDVPYGSNYRIIFGVSPGMWRNTTGATYPYTIPGQISITGNSFSGYPEYYYFFYNWEIGSGSGCESPRTEVWAVVTGNPQVDAGVVSVDLPLSPTNLQAQNATVTIQNYGTNPLTSATINWTVNGVTQTPFAWTGSLATSATAQVNIGTFTPTLGNNNLVVWTSNPNGVTDPMLLNDTASAIIEAFDPLNGIYTIGGTNPNFTNFTQAQYALVNYGVSGPVTFKVRTGTYNEKLSLPAYTGASATNTVTFMPDAGANVVLTTNDTAVVKISDAAWYIFDGSNNGTNSRNFTIANTSTATNTAAIWLAAVNNNIIIKNMNITGTSNSTTSAFGIYVGGATISTTATGNNNNITLHNNAITRSYFGIYARAASTAKNNNLIITNNLIGSDTPSEFVTFRGVDVQGANSPLIEGNEIFNLKIATAVNIAAIDIGQEVTNARISKNIIRGIQSSATGGYGAFGVNISSGTNTSGIEISNNFISDIRTINYSVSSTLYNPFGIRIAGGTGHKIWYNSINLFGAPGPFGSNASMSAALCVTLSSATGMDIRNNIFANSMTGLNGSKAYAVYAVSGTTFSQMDYNNYYASGPFKVFGYLGSDILTLTAWRTATTKDQNSLSVDPTFVLPTNLHTFTASLNAKGTPITGITDDIDGDLRHLTTPDIGADEFEPLNNDISAYQLVTPTSNCQLSTTQSISVNVRNNGLNNITAFSISYSINGGTPVTETFTGNLASDSVHTFTFTTPANMYAINPYSIFIQTTLTGDQYAANDTMTVVIPSLHNFANAYTMGFETSENVSVWSSLNVMNDGSNWVFPYSSTTYANTGTFSARFVNATTNPANDWLFSPCFRLEGGKTYRIEFYYRSQSATTPHNLMLRAGQDKTPTAMTDTILDLNGLINVTHELTSGMISIPSTGTYYFGWHAYSNAATSYFYIDDINIRLLEPKDAAVVSVDNIDTHVNGASVITPEVTIKNWGSDTLTTIPVKYTVNGGTPTTETWTGTLLPDSSVSFTFTTGFTVPSGDFNFCAYTQLSGDGNTANDTTCITPFGIPLLTVPYTDDFEGANMLYTLGSTNQWQLGVPSASVINNAYSPVNVWATNLTGNYGANSNYNLFTPRFNFANTTNVMLGFYYWIDSEIDTDGGRIQYTTNDGNTWQFLGTVGDPLATNWYNSNNVNGAPAFTGQSGTWVYATYDLSQFNNFPVPVQFRFNFFANGTIHNNGWAIDNFALIQSSIPEDAGVIAITSPASTVVTGSSQNVEVMIKNFGTDTLTAIPVRYRVNNGVPVAQQWTGTLAPGDSTNFTFTTPVVETTSYTLCAWTRIPADFYQTNDTTCTGITIIPAMYDAGVIEIVTPVTTTTTGLPTQVSVKIKNFGTETLTSIPVQFDINSGTPVVETWTGTLAPNAEVIFDFTQTYVSPGGNYLFCAQTNLSNDQNLTNNKTCKTLTGTVGIEDSESYGLQLGQNVPNPTSGNTTISYVLPGTGTYSFKVMSTVGQLVYTESGKRNQGTYTIEIDTQMLPAGIYFYALEFEGILRVKKMIVN